MGIRVNISIEFFCLKVNYDRLDKIIDQQVPEMALPKPQTVWFNVEIQVKEPHSYTKN